MWHRVKVRIPLFSDLMLVPIYCYREDTYTLLKRINVLGPIHVIYILHRLTTRVVYYSRHEEKLLLKRKEEK